MPTISSALPMGGFAQEPSMPLLLPFKTWTAALTTEKIRYHQTARAQSLHPELLQLSKPCQESESVTTKNACSTSGMAQVHNRAVINESRRRSLPVIESLVHAAEHGNNLGMIYKKSSIRKHRASASLKDLHHHKLCSISKVHPAESFEHQGSFQSQTVVGRKKSR